MNRDKQNIKTTDWLTRGMTEEEIAREKEKALADIVEVVRCKDCAWYSIFNECCTNTRGIFLCKPNGYCNYGERR